MKANPGPGHYLTRVEQVRLHHPTVRIGTESRNAGDSKYLR